jgi:hypothetical protein
MRIYARIDNGAVAELFETDGDITTMFNPELIWVDITDISPQPEANWSAIEANGDWTFAPVAVPVQSETQLRSQRNSMLSATDWIVIRHRDQGDAGGTPSLTSAQIGNVLAYRQALRDVPQKPGFPATVTWPAVPALSVFQSIGGITPM